MESLKEILLKIEKPLIFASKDNFKNLSHIKDLGKSLNRFLSLLKNDHLTAQSHEVALFVDQLIEIFNDYEWQELEAKQIRIETAMKRLRGIRQFLESTPPYKFMPPKNQPMMQRVSDLKETLTKLELPVQYLKNVGPKWHLVLPQKNQYSRGYTFFLPRTYEDRRE